MKDAENGLVRDLANLAEPALVGTSRCDVPGGMPPEACGPLGARTAQARRPYPITAEGATRRPYQ